MDSPNVIDLHQRRLARAYGEPVAGHGFEVAENVWIVKAPIPRTVRWRGVLGRLLAVLPVALPRL